MTPLQKAAQELLELHLPTYLDTQVSHLRTALEAEKAQAVEPVAWIERDMQCDDFDPDSVTCSTPVGTAEGWEWVPLYLQPAPPASDHVPETAFGNTERSALIAALRHHGPIEKAGLYIDAADMLEADAQPKQVTCRYVTQDEMSALEKALEADQAQEVAVPAGYALVPIEPTGEMLVATDAHPGAWTALVLQYKAMLAAAQGAKLVTKKDSKTDWSAA